MHHGHTAEEYLSAFPGARLIGLEPDAANFRHAVDRLKTFKNAELLPMALSDHCGEATFRPVSHDGSHSLLEIENSPHFEWPIYSLAPVIVETITVDALCDQRGIDTLDVLKMDIQGGELLALQGASRLLSKAAIRLIALETLFKPLYRGQPSFWDLAAHLRDYGYELQGIYDPQHHRDNPAILRWADAIFVSPDMQRLHQPEVSCSAV